MTKKVQFYVKDKKQYTINMYQQHFQNHTLEANLTESI